MTAMRPTSIRLTPETKCRVERRAAATGQTRSHIMEVAVARECEYPLPVGKNQFGVDMHYFDKKLRGILSVLDCVKPTELARMLDSLKGVAERES